MQGIPRINVTVSDDLYATASDQIKDTPKLSVAGYARECFARGVGRAEMWPGLEERIAALEAEVERLKDERA